MKNKRFGDFRFCDYCVSWISIVVLLLFSIACLVLKLSFLFAIFPFVYAVIWLVSILIPHREQFAINNDTITTFVGKRRQTICIPSELTLIISYADICPPLAVRTAYGNETHILKDKFAVSILQKMPKEKALEILHQSRVQMYTTSVIRTAFDDYHYIYSFVCNQSLLDELIANRECLLIVPETLSKKISFGSCIDNVYIDQGH